VTGPGGPSPAVLARPYDHPDVALLVEEVQGEYIARYGGRDATPVDPGQFAAPLGLFLVAYLAGEPVACVGLRRHGDDAMEIKRMYVRAPHRRRGLGRLLLAVLEDETRRAGRARVVLETGTEQPEALALYASSGYQPIEPFGYHRDSPLNRCFAKVLTRGRSEAGADRARTGD
jgi:GNAT superfamily N-acetyltransferase